MATNSLLRELRRVLPRERIIVDRAELSLYDADGLGLHRATPGGVVLVENATEVVAVLRALAAARLPFVARGAGTGLSGGAVALDEAWIIDLNRMRRILEVNVLDRFAVVEPGVVNLELERAAAAHGLRYAPDPSSQKACTLGGNLAENSGGPHCFRHGMTTRHVLGLTIALPDGELLDLGGPPGRGQDLDWRGLFVGAEGTFGVIVRATLALLPRPEKVQTWLATFPRLAAACHAVAAMIRAGLRPAALEVLDRLAIRAVEASIYRAGYPIGAEAVLLIEQEGSTAEVTAEAPRILEICRAAECLACEAAESDADRARLWRGRKGAFGAMGRIARDLYVLDTVVPRRRLAEVVEAIQALGERYRLRLSNVFHAGDGNLHPNISFDARDADERARVLACSADIARLCVTAGGTLSGEHGIGLEKRDFLPLVFTDSDLATQKAVRDAIDPGRRANPKKIFPTGRGCVEAGHRTESHARRAERIIE